MKMKAGDFIRMEIEDIHTVEANGVSALKARLGSLNGHLALEVESGVS